MRFTEYGRPVPAAAAVAASVLWLAVALDAAPAAEDKTYVMKITLPTLNDTVHQLAKNYAAAVEKDSGGRIKAEVYPASQLGPIARQIEGVQFGAIQCAVIPPEFFVGVDERFEVMTAPGLVDSMAHGQRLAADPAVQKLMLGLGANKGCMAPRSFWRHRPRSSRRSRSAPSSTSRARSFASSRRISSSRRSSGSARRRW